MAHMKLKTFRARTMADALAAVKGEFGSAAVILHTKQFKVGGLFGIWGKPVVEVVASDQAIGTRTHEPNSPSSTATTPDLFTHSRAPTNHSARSARHTIEPKPQNNHRDPNSAPSAQATLTDRARALEAYLTTTNSPGIAATATATTASARSRTASSAYTPSQTASNDPQASQATTTTSPFNARRTSSANTTQQPTGLFTSQPSRDLDTAVAVMPVRQRGRSSRNGRDATGLNGYPAANDPTGLDHLITSAAFSPSDDATEHTIERELSTIKRLVSQLLSASPAGTAVGVLPQPLFDAHVRLIENDVDREIADLLVGTVRDELSASELLDPSIVRQTLLRRIESCIPVVNSAWGEKSADQPNAGRRVVALVGATGVGKTTTIAKLAATFKLRHGRRVGLVTADTYRIAAVDQLRTYAEIISLPLKVAMSPGEMQRAVDSLENADIILVDTAGRSPSDSARLGELGEFLDAAKPTETHLVLSATADQRVQLRTAEKFAAFNPDRVILTKLDESDRHGPILNVLTKLGLPLSFVTTGQEVPDHIEQARADKLARLVLDGLQTQPSKYATSPLTPSHANHAEAAR